MNPVQRRLSPLRRLQRYWGWGHRRGQPTGRSRSHRRVEAALPRNDITRNSDVDAIDVTNARVSADDITSEGDAVTAVVTLPTHEVKDAVRRTGGAIVETGDSPLVN